MPWKEVKPMNEKIRFISDYLNNFFPFSELCLRYNISRKTGYKWISRYEEFHDPSCLKDRSKKPHHIPNKTPEEVIKDILNIREKHPFWGPKKILWRMGKDHPERQLPARSTVSLILQRNGCIKKKRKKINRSHPGRPMTEIDKPNTVWTADFKGQFKTIDGKYCYPLTVADGYSRYLFSCKGMLSPSHMPVKSIFKRLFEEYGLPEYIRTDNGNPFASVALGRLSRLSIWWIKLGILPDLIEPGCPQQNGRHERMHRTLKCETTIPPGKNLTQQQIKFDNFIDEYNNERPHESLNMKTPAEVFTYSSRPMPSKLPQIEYPAHFEVRRVSKNSGMKWNNHRICVSYLLADEYVGLEEVDNGIWNVYFGPVWLGRFYERFNKIMDDKGYLLRKIAKQKCYLSP